MHEKKDRSGVWSALAVIATLVTAYLTYLNYNMSKGERVSTFRQAVFQEQIMAAREGANEAHRFFRDVVSTGWALLRQDRGEFLQRYRDMYWKFYFHRNGANLLFVADTAIAEAEGKYADAADRVWSFLGQWAAAIAPNDKWKGMAEADFWRMDMQPVKLDVNREKYEELLQELGDSHYALLAAYRKRLGIEPLSDSALKLMRETVTDPKGSQ